MTIYEFVKKNKDLRNYTSEVFPLYGKVVTQALRHTTRSPMDDLHKIARPNEDDIFTKWRKDNRRHVTVDYINQFCRMLKRILSQTIETNYEYTDLDRFIFNSLIPLSIQDPNVRVIEWPFMSEYPNVPPANGNFYENQALDSESKIIFSEKIKVHNDDLFIYFKDFVLVEKEKYERYVGIDKIGYYILQPKLNEKREIYYEPITWYKHKLGFLPVSELPGIIVNEKLESGFAKYKESVCWPAFEWFDEGVVRMSSEQVVSIKHANAKLVVNGDIPCPTCSGSGVNGHTKDETGKQIPKTCKTCNGSRNISSISDFSTIKLKNNATQPGDKVSSNPIYYLEPPGGIKELQDSFMLFFELGKKALCNDLLEGTGNESGIAKELRLEPKQDLMMEYGQQICYLIEDLVNNRNLLRGNKKIIQVTPPVYYETKSPEILKMSIVDSLQGERFLRFMDWVKVKFKDDVEKIKLHKYAALYAPLILYKAEEFDGAYNAGVYDERDAIKRDYAFWAVGEVLKKNKNLNSLKEIKELADKLLIDEGIMTEPLEIDVEQRSKLLDTVRGV